MVRRRGAVLNAQQLIEFLPEVRRELGASVRSKIGGNTKSGNPVPNESSCTSLCLGIRDRNSFWPTSETVDHREEVSHPLADWERSNQVNVECREARSWWDWCDERGTSVSVDF